jgi:asparagine synthase (glutamine-hydrolysing)
MAEMVRHRGPDDLGSWSDGRVGLGHARLSIIDLSHAAHQPMVDEAESVRLVYNGEIYNFPQLRQELLGLGHHFKSTSDTEVILRGYLQWGAGVVARLRGMFAFALWDGSGHRMLLARDRIGQKPLNYGWAGSTFVFGSEIKSILRWPGFERSANLDALQQYFLFRYVPGTDTAFNGIFRLEPAHYALIDASGRMEKHRYWELPEPGSGPKRDEATLCGELLEQLDEATHMRMISDVPLGAFLSGGVDSSAIVASMAQASTEPVRTFTVGFEADTGIDERRYARMVAERYGTNHTEYVINPDVDAISHTLAWHYGEPYADEVTIPTYCISAIARRDVTVALNGDGGDESFLGYRRHAASRLGARLDFLPMAARRLLARLGESNRFDSHNRTVRNVGKALLGAAASPVERYTNWVTYGSHDLLDLLATQTAREELYAEARRRFEPFFAPGIRPEDAASRADMQALLNENLEVRVDIATMANSLEGRSPLLDHKLIEWAVGVPARQRMRGLELKYLLKKALLERVPREVMYRPKQGFFMDFAFLSAREEMIRDVVLSPRVAERGLLDPVGVRLLVEQHYNGGNKHHAEIYMLFILEQWFQMWIDPPEIPVAPPPKPTIA